MRRTISPETPLQLGPFVKPLRREDLANLANFKIGARNRGYSLRVVDTEREVTVIATRSTKEESAA